MDRLMAGIFLVERDGTRLAELDAAQADELTWTLNGPGAATVTVDPADPKLASLTLGGGVEVQVWDDELDAPWWGIPDGVPQIGPTGPMQIPCSGLEAHFASRLVVASFAYVDLEQLAVGQWLVEHAQDNAVQSGDADLGIAIADWEPSGRERQGAFHAYERPNVADRLAAMTGINDGFDWSIEVMPDGRREWTPWYPRRGELRDVYEWDDDARDAARGIVTWSGITDGQTVNEAHVAGDGDGPSRLYGIHTDTAARARDGLRQARESASDGTVELATLVDRARRIVADRKDPRSTPTLTVRSTDKVSAGSIRPGDRFEVRIRRGWWSTSGEWRVTQVTYRRSSKTAVLEVARA